MNFKSEKFQNIFIIILLVATILIFSIDFIQTKADTNNSIVLKEKKAIFKNLYSVFLYKASSVLLNATDNILISIIVGTIAVGYYSNYLLIQTNIVNLYALLFTSINYTLCEHFIVMK